MSGVWFYNLGRRSKTMSMEMNIFVSCVEALALAGLLLWIVYRITQR